MILKNFKNAYTVMYISNANSKFKSNDLLSEDLTPY